jgi:D-alanyl-D-alanine carboxypeptidase
VQNLGQYVRNGLFFLVTAFVVALSFTGAQAAPYAAMVIDARTGEVLHSRNADTRLHPASLTKMMTLYIAFEAIENGEISLDTMVRVSKHAASEPPSKLGLKPGQRIALRYLIRAAAVKSANDAATAIGEAIEGSEAAFARRMNRTAKALGMSRTTFRNANGLTREGHLSTARDMTTLGRHLFYDYPEYYNLFSRRSTNAGVREVANTNRRLLAAYRGADGIKTGYTRAAGFNLVASAERGGVRIIATVFGGRSSATRNARVAELLDMGFARAPSRVAVRKPARPVYAGGAETIRLVRAVETSPRPMARPGARAPQELLVAMQDDIQQAVTEANAAPAAAAPPRPQMAEAEITPKARPEKLQLASLSAGTDEAQVPEVVTRMSTSGGHHWGINVGRYPTRYQAERVLLSTALQELGALDDALRKVVQNSRGFEANFVGMTQEQAALACRRLEARGADCTTFGPKS